MNAIGAGQASLFDQYKAMYNKYRVNGGKIKIRWFPDTSGINGSALVVCTPNSVSTLPPTLLDHSEQKGAKLGQGAALSAGPQGQILNMYKNCHDIMGVNKQTYKDDSYSALVTATPSDLVYYVVSIGHPDGVSLVDGTLWVTLTQYITFFEPLVVTDA